VHARRAPFEVVEDIKRLERPTEAILSPSRFSLLSLDCTRVPTYPLRSYVDSDLLRSSVPLRFVPDQR
jgi:hypothetical protein